VEDGYCKRHHPVRRLAVLVRRAEKLAALLDEIEAMRQRVRDEGLGL
jgi:hypothetical protein